MEMDQSKAVSQDQTEMTMMMRMMMQVDMLPQHQHQHYLQDHPYCSPTTNAGLPMIKDFTGTSTPPSLTANNQQTSSVSVPQPMSPYQNSGAFSVSSSAAADINGYRAAQPQGTGEKEEHSSMTTMREMIFRLAVMQPVNIDPESVKAPKRRNVRVSKDPQSVAARHRRERISERIRILQRLVPGGTKMDTASMLDEAIHYVKFLKTQVQSLERAAATNRDAPPPAAAAGLGFSGTTSGMMNNDNISVGNYIVGMTEANDNNQLPCVVQSFQHHHHH